MCKRTYHTVATGVGILQVCMAPKFEHVGFPTRGAYVFHLRFVIFPRPKVIWANIERMFEPIIERNQSTEDQKCQCKIHYEKNDNKAFLKKYVLLKKQTAQIETFNR